MFFYNLYSCQLLITNKHASSMQKVRISALTGSYSMDLQIAALDPLRAKNLICILLMQSLYVLQFVTRFALYQSYTCSQLCFTKVISRNGGGDWAVGAVLYRLAVQFPTDFTHWLIFPEPVLITGAICQKTMSNWLCYSASLTLEFYQMSVALHTKNHSFTQDSLAFLSSNGRSRRSH